MRFRLTTFLLVLLSTAVVRAGEREMETRFFDLGSILREHREAMFVALGPITCSFEESWSDEENLGRFLDAEEIVSVVRGSGLFGDGHEVWVDSEQLGVRAGRDELRAVEKLLAGIRRAAAQRIEVSIRLGEIGAFAGAKLLAEPAFREIGTGSLDAAVAAELAQRIRGAGGTVRDVNTVSRPARRSSAGQVSKRSYVRDMDVEIAGGTVVGDPRVAWIREGWQVDVRPHLLAGGGTFLEVMLQTSLPAGEARRVALEGDELGRVELPAVTERTLFSTGSMPAGRVMSLVLQVGGRVAVLLVEPRVGRRPIGRHLDTTALTGAQPGCAMVWGDDDDVRADAEADVPRLFPPRPLIVHRKGRSTIVENLMLSVASRLGWTVQGSWMESGRGVWMLGDPSEAAPVRKELAAIEARVLRTVPVRVRVRRDGRDALAANLLVVPGRRICVSAGETRAYVGDWDVEVASEGARIGDPEIHWAWGGTALNLVLDAGAEDGEWTARVTGEIVVLEDGFETIRTGSAVTGIIESPRGRAVAVDADAVLAAGRPTILKPADGVTVEIEICYSGSDPD